MMNRIHNNPGHQKGFTLTELLVASAVSLVAVSGMVLVMANTLGTTGEVIAATRLAGEMRASVQVLARDLRRANYSDDFISCIGTGDITCLEVADSMTVVTGNPGCLAYDYDRDGSLVSGSVRLNTTNKAMEFNSSSSNCAATSGWDQLTDPDLVEITAFTITEESGTDLSYTQQVTPTQSLRVKKYLIQMTGRICTARLGSGACSADGWVTRELETTIRVRNDTLFQTPVTT